MSFAEGLNKLWLVVALVTCVCVVLGMFTLVPAHVLKDLMFEIGFLCLESKNKCFSSRKMNSDF